MKNVLAKDENVLDKDEKRFGRHLGEPWVLKKIIQAMIDKKPSLTNSVVSSKNAMGMPLAFFGLTAPKGMP